MKLQTQLFLITDSKGKEINVEKKNIILALNGERLTTELKSIFSGLEFDAGEIYGNSLISYYNVNEDGSLEVEGSKVQLLDSETDEPILVKRIKRPSVHDDTSTSFEDIQKFAEYFKIAKPDEVFSNLSAPEKQVFIDERTSREETAKNEAATATANEEASKAAEALIDKKKAEAELRASIDPAYVQDKVAYESTDSFYKALDGFKKYIQEPYQLFYGEDPNESLCILIKRGDTWFEEVKPENFDITDKTANTVVIEFNDGEIRKQLTLALDSGQIEIIDALAKE